MENKNSSAMPINYHVMGLPISSGTGEAISMVFVCAPLLSEPDKESNQYVVFDLKGQENNLEQLWHWTEPQHLYEKDLEILYTPEMSWEQASEDVLRHRAETWKELAGL